MSNPTRSCDPWAAVYAVADMLRANGIPTRLDGNNIAHARLAGVELLAAFDVEPVATPDDGEAGESARLI